jgi:hypothetical protein
VVRGSRHIWEGMGEQQHGQQAAWAIIQHPCRMQSAQLQACPCTCTKLYGERQPQQKLAAFTSSDTPLRICCPKPCHGGPQTLPCPACRLTPSRPPPCSGSSSWTVTQRSCSSSRRSSHSGCWTSRGVCHALRQHCRSGRHSWGTCRWGRSGGGGGGGTHICTSSAGATAAAAAADSIQTLLAATRRPDANAQAAAGKWSRAAATTAPLCTR